MAKVYALGWTGSGTIPSKVCYTDKAWAEACLTHANNKIHWRNRILGHRYFMITLTVKEGFDKEDSRDHS
jgi:hypothetical protein